MLWYAFYQFLHLHSIFRLLLVALLSHWLGLTDMQALPEDLKTKLSIDDELVSSPKEAFSRVSADRRNKLMKRFHNNILVFILNCCSRKVENICWNLVTWMKLADSSLSMLSSGLSHSYSTHGDKNIVKLSKLTDSNRRFGGGRTPEPPAINQVTFVNCYITKYGSSNLNLTYGTLIRKCSCFHLYS